MDDPYEKSQINNVDKFVEMIKNQPSMWIV